MSSSAEHPLPIPQRAQPLTFSSLPHDVKLKIAGRLTNSDLNRLARTSNANFNVFNMELYKRDAETLNPQALLWGAFTGYLRPMEFFLSQPNADINQVFIWPSKSKLFQKMVMDFAIDSGVNTSTTHVYRLSFRGSDDTGYTRFYYKWGPGTRWTDSKNSPFTALHFAAVFNQVEVTKFLLKNGADPTVTCPRDGYFVLKDKDDPLPRPPLFTALKTKSEDVAELLLRHGVSPLWAPPGAGKHAKETALLITARLGMWKLLELLVRAGVDANAGCHVDDVPKWSADPAGQSILQRLCYLPGTNSRTRKPSEKVISELVRLGARATLVKEVGGRNNKVHLVLQLIMGYTQSKKIKTDWPLTCILLKTGACDGTLEQVEVLAAIQLVLFPRDCPYMPTHARHTLSDLTQQKKKWHNYSRQASLRGTKCMCKLASRRGAQGASTNGIDWQKKLLQNLITFQVRQYGQGGLDSPLPFITETVLTLLARHRDVDTTALQLWLELMPAEHKAKVVNDRRQTALHVALSMESFDEKLWYIEGKPTINIDRAFDPEKDVLFFLLKRCTSEELLAVDDAGCTPLDILLGALYWDQDDEYYKDNDSDFAGSGEEVDSGQEDGSGRKPGEPFSDYTWARKCLAFVERMLSEIPELSDDICQQVTDKLHWLRLEISCEEGSIYLGRTGGRGRMRYTFPSFAPRAGEMRRPIPRNPPVLSQQAYHPQ